MPLRKTKSHKISLKAAAEMTKRHRGAVSKRTRGKASVADGDLGGLFASKAVKKLLANPKAHFLRFYYGKNKKGGRELILLASDANGNDLTDDILDTHWPCPPVCTGADSDRTLRG